MSKKTHPRTKPTQITRTFPGTEPPDDDRDVVVQIIDDVFGEDKVIGYYCKQTKQWFAYSCGWLTNVRRWAELPTFPKQKGKK